MNISEILATIEAGVLDLGTSSWLILIILILCCIDGFFPTVPSESVVIAAAALVISAGDSASFLPLVFGAAALGALAGDLIAHRIGARIPLERLTMLRGPRGKSILSYAQRSLHTRGVTFILTGRFVPVGRVTVNMTAGAVKYPTRRFTAVASVASLLWAGFSVAMGIGAGYLVRDDPVAAMVVGICVGLLVALGVDALLRRCRREPPTNQSRIDVTCQDRN